MEIFRAATALYVQNKQLLIPNLSEIVSAVRKEPRCQIVDTIYQLREQQGFQGLKIKDDNKTYEELMNDEDANSNNKRIS